MFNTNISKQTHEINFFQKTMKLFNKLVFFNEVPIGCSISQKYLDLHLDQNFGFNKHINGKILKTQKIQSKKCTSNNTNNLFDHI